MYARLYVCMYVFIISLILILTLKLNSELIKKLSKLRKSAYVIIYLKDIFKCEQKIMICMLITIK